ncbi:hypothetical protein E4U41_001876, partial [Claviceps citrina]
MPARKRSAPEPSTGGPRRSGRLVSGAYKSSYFEEEIMEEEEDALKSHDSQQPAAKRQRKALPKRQQQSKYKHKSGQDQCDEQPFADEAHGGEDPDDDDDDDGDDDDAPRKVEIIPLEKMRDTGGVDYADHKLHRNTLLFLKDLKANNRRAWLKSHDGEYRRALQDWQSFVETATQTIIGVDETVPELPVKDVIFRIYRDVRFSKIKTPYKPYFSAAWSRTGRKGPYACYYVHCEPGSSFVGAGLWQPHASLVAKLRRSIDRHPERWRRVLNEAPLKKLFFPAVGAAAGPDAALEAFALRNRENALKKRPMGYEITHRDIELLKLRNYTISTAIDADVFANDHVQARLAELIRGLSGF